MTKTITIELPDDYVFVTKAAGEGVQYHPEKMHQSWVMAFLEKGMQRYANDKYSGSEPSVKLDQCRALAADANSGEELIAAVRGGGVARLPDDVALALKMAKQDLTLIFKKVTGKNKAADFIEHEKVKPFFKAKGDNMVWNEQVVSDWIAKQAEAGKRDYIAEAKASLAVDVDDLDL